MPTPRISTDQFSLTTDEAAELCAHHLRLAALFYQSTGEDAESVHTEILRLIQAADHEDAHMAATAFLSAIGAYYAALKAKDL